MGGRAGALLVFAAQPVEPTEQQRGRTDRRAACSWSAHAGRTGRCGRHHGWRCGSIRWAAGIVARYLLDSAVGKSGRTNDRDAMCREAGRRWTSTCRSRTDRLGGWKSCSSARRGSRACARDPSDRSRGRGGVTLEDARADDHDVDASVVVPARRFPTLTRSRDPIADVTRRQHLEVLAEGFPNRQMPSALGFSDEPQILRGVDLWKARRVEQDGSGAERALPSRTARRFEAAPPSTSTLPRRRTISLIPR